jgi:hypothetical protein
MIDQKVLEFVKSHVFDPVDFVIRSDGVCRLNPEIARCIVGLVAQRPLRFELPDIVKRILIRPSESYSII